MEPSLSPLNFSAAIQEPDPGLDHAGYLKSIQAVRDRVHKVLEKAEDGKLNHFQVNWEKMNPVSEYVAGIIKVMWMFLS